MTAYIVRHQQSAIFQQAKMTWTNEGGISGVYDSAEVTAWKGVKKRTLDGLVSAFPLRTYAVPAAPGFDTRSSANSRRSCGLDNSERRKPNFSKPKNGRTRYLNDRDKRKTSSAPLSVELNDELASESDVLDFQNATITITANIEDAEIGRSSAFRVDHVVECTF